MCCSVWAHCGSEVGHREEFKAYELLWQVVLGLMLSCRLGGDRVAAVSGVQTGCCRVCQADQPRFIPDHHDVPLMRCLGGIGMLSHPIVKHALLVMSAINTGNYHQFIRLSREVCPLLVCPFLEFLSRTNPFITHYLLFIINLLFLF